jgi:hypothetical protein
MTTDDGVARGTARHAENEFSMPPNYVPGPGESLTDDVFVNAEQAPEQVGFSRRVNGQWVPVTYRMLAEQVTRVRLRDLDRRLRDSPHLRDLLG